MIPILLLNSRFNDRFPGRMNLGAHRNWPSSAHENWPIRCARKCTCACAAKFYCVIERS